VNQDVVISIVTHAMEVGLKVSLPVLLVGLVVGLVISVFQAVTQIQEQTLSFIPKVLGLVVVIIVVGPWMLDQILSWTQELYGSIPSLVGA
jgi:flagellar biosynthetic protein FliQ